MSFSRIKYYLTTIILASVILKASYGINANPVPVQDTIQYQKKAGMVKKGSLVPLPLIFYSPETSLSLGGVLFNLFRIVPEDTLSNFSYVRTALIFTLRSQILANVEHDIFTRDENYRINGNFTFAKFPDYFYGIGNRTAGSAEEQFSSNNFNFRTQVMRKLYDKIYLGLIYNFNYIGNIETEEGGLLDTEDIAGQAGGVSSGLGMIFQWDTRDFNLNCTSGHFIELTTRHFRDYMGSDFTYNLIEMDARKFYTLAPAHVLGFQFNGRFSNRNVPFHQLSLLGGDEMMRGYYRGRYRDKVLYAFQAEYRWRFYRRFGLVVFGGMGDVSPAFDNFDVSEIKPSYGLGLRYMILPERRVNLRLDFGLGKDTNGIYINIIEAF